MDGERSDEAEPVWEQAEVAELEGPEWDVPVWISSGSWRAGEPHWVEDPETGCGEIA